MSQCTDGYADFILQCRGAHVGNEHLIRIQVLGLAKSGRITDIDMWIRLLTSAPSCSGEVGCRQVIGTLNYQTGNFVIELLI